MKKNLAYSPIEPLEQRIAPALLVYGANLLGGANNPSKGESSIGENNYVTVKVLTGQAVVWYDGSNITGISVGPNVTLDITGDVGPLFHNVEGSIIANLTADGRLTDSDHNPANGDDGLLILPNNILGITTHPVGLEPGSIANIITGGSVSNLSISGELHGIYAGNGLFRDGSLALQKPINVHMTINPVKPLDGSSFTFSEAANSFASGALQSGATISNVVVQTARGLQIYAGDGNAAGAGGSVQGITIGGSLTSSDSGPTYEIKAGDGASSAVRGGDGGSISRIIDHLSTTGNANIFAGQGGDGGTGAGGAGGSITGLDLQSSFTFYSAKAGVGGNGAPGGPGGNVSNANFAGNTPGTGIVVSAPFTHEINPLLPLPASDVLMVDSSSGKMVVLKNGGNGSTFTAVTQDDLADFDPNNDVLTVASKTSSSPTDAVAADMNNDGLMDVVVSYADGTVGVYLNTLGEPGVFTKQLFSEGSYTGSETTGSQFSVKAFPITHVVTGHFGGAGLPDIALISTTKTQTILNVATNTPATLSAPAVFTVTTTQQLSAGGSALAVETSSIGSADHIVVGFSSGLITTYNSAGGTITSTLVTGAISGLDTDPQAHRMLALTKSGGLFVFAYDDIGSLIPISGPDLSTQTGKAIVAHFVHDPTTVEDSIAILSSVSTGSRLDVFSVSAGLFSLGSSVNSSVGLKNFAVSYEAPNVHGIAALPGSIAHFDYSFSESPFVDFTSHLPGGKQVAIYAGDGGAGVDPDLLGKVVAKGGSGGNITAVNAEADQILLQAGNGGNTLTGAAGAGGSVTNPATMTTLTGTALVPKLTADIQILVQAGNGGSPTGANPLPVASGGNGGSVTGISVEVTNSDPTRIGRAEIYSGNGGNGHGGAAGNAGNIINLKSHLLDGNLIVTAGSGGSATGGKVKGGSGGSIKGLTHFLDLPNDETELPIVEKPYSVNLTGGAGGDSPEGPAGAGGSVANVNLVLDTSNETYDSLKKHGADFIIDTHVDSTLRVIVGAGDGGDGAIGGAGGAITAVKLRAYYDQVDLDFGNPMLSSVVLSMTSGDGGTGSTGVGGNGGAINLGAANSLLGVTGFDADATYYFDASEPMQDSNGNFLPQVAPLRIESGHGGNGATKGGAGGAVSSVFSANSLWKDNTIIVGQELGRAEVTSGDGGTGGISDGGAGGSISKLSIGAGSLRIQSGNGGNGGTNTMALLAKSAKGGAGGAISGSLLGSVMAGVNLFTGSGGSGVTGGGNGGLMTGIQFNGAQESSDTNLVTGDGGDASGMKAKAGNGGDIIGITQSKDINSAIYLIEAGNGGSNTVDGNFGIGGNGGSVKQVYEAGFIGQPGSGVMVDSTPQGLFVGRGGSGAKTNGAAGSVLNIHARQISAIAAAMDGNGLFGLATSISNVTADLIGYDSPLGAANTYQDSMGGHASPTVVAPLDGFLLAKAFSKIVTFDNARTILFENPTA